MVENNQSESHPSIQGSRALSGRQIAQAAGLVIVGFMLSRVLGLVRESIVAGIFGLTTAYDAYVAALQVPDTIFFVIAGGAIGSAFIPTFTAYLARKDQGEAWRMASAVINIFILVLIAISGLAILFARPIATLTLAQGFPPDVQDLTIRLMRIMLLSPIIFGISGIQMGMLNAHQRFLLPALAPSMYNVGIIFGAIFAQAFDGGIEAVAWGVVIGAGLHLAVQVPGLLKIKARYHPVLAPHHPGVREVAGLMGPRVLGQAVVQVNFWINTSLASGMGEGSVGAIRRAWFLLMLPQGLIAQSVATAVFPTFAAQVANDKPAQLRATLGQVLRAVMFLSLPATVGLVMLRLPLVSLIYEYGKSTPQESEAVAWALLFLALGLAAHSLVEIVTRAFYAMFDTRTPVLIGVMAMGLNVVLSFWLITVIGEPGSLVRGPFAGLALANTLATTLEGVLLLVIIWRRVGGLEGRRFLRSVLQAGGASAGMGLALWALNPAIISLGQFIGPVAGIAAGGAVFWGLALLFGSEEARLFTGVVAKRLQRLR